VRKTRNVASAGHDAARRGRADPAGMTTQRRTLLLAFGGVLAAAVAVAVALVLVSRGSGSDATPAAPAVRSSVLAGIPQRGAELGDPAAPALYEFADLQCPYCGEFSRVVLPDVVRDDVRTGRVKLVFRGLAFVGPDSTKALRAVAAAGRQNRLWDVLDGLYAAQGAENSGWVTDDLLRQVGESIPGLDVDRWLADAGSDAVTPELAAWARHATDLRVGGTPTFFLGDRVLELRELTPDAFRAALDPLLGE
jgi:protein-disulfide isomerase